MGIGAYECREVISALGGQVKVESVPGRGTVFRILLPLDEQQASGLGEQRVAIEKDR
jgi:signal transduction histidine kinase